MKQITNTIKGKLRRGAVGALVGLASLMPIESMASESLKYVKPVEGENSSYVEADSFYSLPGDIKGYTWADLSNGGGFYGETNLEKEVVSGVNAKVQVNHPNSLVGRTSLGMSAKVPYLPKGVFAKVSAFPIVLDKDGKIIDRSEVSYFASTKLPFGLDASSYGEVDLKAKGGPTWGYGEIDVGKDIAKGVRFSYNPALNSAGQGKVIPELEHRLAVKVNF